MPESGHKSEVYIPLRNIPATIGSGGFQSGNENTSQHCQDISAVLNAMDPLREDDNFHVAAISRFETVIINIAMLISILISPAMIFIGYKYIGECPKQKYIPWFLLIAGFLTISSMVLVKYRTAVGHLDYQNFSERIFLYLTNLVTWLTFSFYILGSTWVYGAYEPVYVRTEETTLDYCNQQLYTFAFYLINSILIMIAVIVLWTLCSFMIDVIYV